MQASSCVVAELTLVARLTSVTGVCLIDELFFNHMQACSCLVAELVLVAAMFVARMFWSSTGVYFGSGAYSSSGAYSNRSTAHDIAMIFFFYVVFCGS